MACDKCEIYKRELSHLYDVLAQKNRALDALHYVWCNGGCGGGVHRYNDGVVNEELVQLAEALVARLRTWWTNKEFRDTWNSDREFRKQWYLEHGIGNRLAQEEETA